MKLGGDRFLYRVGGPLPLRGAWEGGSAEEEEVQGLKAEGWASAFTEQGGGEGPVGADPAPKQTCLHVSLWSDPVEPVPGEEGVQTTEDGHKEEDGGWIAKGRALPREHSHLSRQLGIWGVNWKNAGYQYQGNCLGV